MALHWGNQVVSSCGTRTHIEDTNGHNSMSDHSSNNSSLIFTTNSDTIVATRQSDLQTDALPLVGLVTKDENT